MVGSLLVRRALRVSHYHKPASALAHPISSSRPLTTLSPPPRPSSSPSLAPTTPTPSSRRLASALSPSSEGVPALSLFAPLDTFERRHVGPRPADVAKMLEVVGYPTMDAFVDAVVPPSIRLSESHITSSGPDGIRALSEQELLTRAKELGGKNKVMTSFIGMGYHQAVSRIAHSGLARAKNDWRRGTRVACCDGLEELRLTTTFRLRLCRLCRRLLCAT